MKLQLYYRPIFGGHFILENKSTGSVYQLRTDTFGAFTIGLGLRELPRDAVPVTTAYYIEDLPSRPAIEDQFPEIFV